MASLVGTCSSQPIFNRPCSRQAYTLISYHGRGPCPPYICACDLEPLTAAAILRCRWSL